MVVVMLGKPGPVKNLQGSPESKKIKVEWTSPEDPEDDPESLHYRVSCQGVSSVGKTKIDSKYRAFH
ncbi:hypothetical protein DPMN_164408 [Dreissena polymorpha]|uniref:Fibronectin type-III domain-containing protein n=1 Tax=Dreissena polymorpha TaxID=45954 RepID=A0A9D4EYN3_DREPO|nr:hypothetical protein DPMN_164408 [Dreissena polymorpha]